MRLTQRHWRLLLWVVMLVGVLFAVRPLTSQYSPETLFAQSDKVTHFLYFGLLWALARRAGFVSAWPLALAFLGYGVFIEVAQALVPTGRSASLADVVADAYAIAVAWWLMRRWSSAQPEKNSG